MRESTTRMPGAGLGLPEDRRHRRSNSEDRPMDKKAKQPKKPKKPKIKDSGTAKT
jgi:hypothetical protein